MLNLGKIHGYFPKSIRLIKRFCQWRILQKNESIFHVHKAILCQQKWTWILDISRAIHFEVKQLYFVQDAFRTKENETCAQLKNNNLTNNIEKLNLFTFSFCKIYGNFKRINYFSSTIFQVLTEIGMKLARSIFVLNRKQNEGVFLLPSGG